MRRMTSLSRKFSAFLTISRANIQVASLPHATLGILLAVNTLSSFINWSVLIYVILFFMTLTFSCNLNCLCDLNVDERYKKFMSNAVKLLGIKNLKIILLLESIVIFFLIYILSVRGNKITAFISILGFICAIIYSAEPFRVKKRGIFSPLPVLIGLYILPILGGWFIFKSSLPWFIIIFIIGYGLMNEGFTLVNTCEDYSEDRKEGIKTWAHVFGLKKTLLLAFIFSISGFLCLTSFLIECHLSIFTYIMLVVSSFGILYASKEVYIANKGENLEESAKKYATKMRIWFMMTRYPLLFTALSLFL